MDCSGDSECVEEALNGLLVDIFLQCDKNSTLTATLKAKCCQHDVNSQEENLVELFQKLKQRRIVEKDNVDFLKQVAEAGHREDVKKRIEEFGEGKWRSRDQLKTPYSRRHAFRWPETLDYGSNALGQVLLRFVQNEEHMNDREKSAFFIYCDGLIKPSLDFSSYLRDPFLLIQQLMDHGVIGPRNLYLLKRFFSLETVRKPKEISILECFEAGAFYKQILETYCGTSPNSGRETDEPRYIPWIETARLIRRVIKKSFKGTKRLHVIRNLLQHILESAGKDRLISILIEEVCLDGKQKKWQHVLKILVISGEICCLLEPPWREFTIAEMSRALGVFSDPKIVLQTHDFKNFLKQKEALLSLEREAMKTEDDIQSTSQKNDQSTEDRDEDDDFEALNSFFTGIDLFHWERLPLVTIFTTQKPVGERQTETLNVQTRFSSRISYMRSIESLNTRLRPCLNV